MPSAAVARPPPLRMTSPLSGELKQLHSQQMRGKSHCVKIISKSFLLLLSYSTETDRWSVSARLPGGSRSQHAAVKRRERILVSGGLDHGQGLDQHQVLDTLLEFCPQQETWREVSRMPRARADHTMILYDDMVYFVGGWRDSGEGRVLIPEVDR